MQFFVHFAPLQSIGRHRHKRFGRAVSVSIYIVMTSDLIVVGAAPGAGGACGEIPAAARRARVTWSVAARLVSLPPSM